MFEFCASAVRCEILTKAENRFSKTNSSNLTKQSQIWYKMSLSPGIHMLDPTDPNHKDLLSQIVCLHASCIQSDHTMATFHPPLSYSRMYEHWTLLLEETINQKRIILVHLSRPSDQSVLGQQLLDSKSSVTLFDDLPTSTQAVDSLQQDTTVSDLVLTGTASLVLPSSETGPFRGLIGNLFVDSAHRRQGIARSLLGAIERHALHHKRWNLMLDTTVGTPAEHLYPKLGWQRLGVVKDYGISPKDGRLLDEVFYVKDLRSLP